MEKKDIFGRFSKFNARQISPLYGKLYYIAIIAGTRTLNCGLVPRVKKCSGIEITINGYRSKKGIGKSE